jgi:hypothetical protein
MPYVKKVSETVKIRPEPAFNMKEILFADAAQIKSGAV